MLIRNYLEVQPQEYTEQARGVTIRVVIGKKEGAPHFAMRVFELDPGGYTPLHSHLWEHEVFVLGGAGAVFSEGEERRLQQGDAVFLPAGEKHQFRADAKSSLRFLCVIPHPRD